MPLEGNATVSARDALMSALWDNYTVAQKNAFIDALVHELAEQQRASGCDEYCRGTDCCSQHGGVADLIDPLKDTT
jgi:hypothetical protein